MNITTLPLCFCAVRPSHIVAHVAHVAHVLYLHVLMVQLASKQTSPSFTLKETVTIRLSRSPGCKDTEQRKAKIWKFHAIRRQNTLNNLYETYSTN